MTQPEVPLYPIVCELFEEGVMFDFDDGDFPGEFFENKSVEILWNIVNSATEAV